MVAVFLPFAILAPHGLWLSVWDQASRPIQIESLAASFLTTFAHPHAILSTSSVSIAGYHWLETLTTAVELAALVALWIAFARGPADRERFLRYAAACVCAFVAFGKVLSPQYLIWLVPLVALVRGRARARRGCAPRRAHGRDPVLVLRAALRGPTSTTSRTRRSSLLRDLGLVALLVLLAWP